MSATRAQTSAAGRRRTIIGFLVREGSALILASCLIFVFWGGFEPNLDTVSSAMWHVLAVAIVCLVYVALQAIAAVTQPLGRETWPLVDILVSFVPFLVIGYVLVEWTRGNMQLSLFQTMTIILVAISVTIDIVLFTRFSRRINKLATDIVEMG